MSMFAPSPWSTEQQEWLQAMGYQVLAPARPAEQSPAISAEPSSASASEVTGSTTSPRLPADSPLLRALAKAAGRAPQDAEFLRVLPDLATLRGNPVARRALWPRLRALRRREGA